MKNPPTKHHELLALALTDYDAIAKNPRYEIDMCYWHVPTGKTTCSVCLAGCVMANSLDAVPDHIFDPGDFSAAWCKALTILNDLREGRLGWDWSKVYPVTLHHHNRTQWRIDMQHLLEYLQLQDL